jgi:hypothetical protein
MTKTGIGTTEAWRHFWLTNVMIDTGKLGPAKLVRREMGIRKDSLARRLHKLRCKRAVLAPR